VATCVRFAGSPVRWFVRQPLLCARAGVMVCVGEGEMDAKALVRLFGVERVGVGNDVVLDGDSVRYADVRGAVGRVVTAPPAEIVVVEGCARVAAVRVVPQVVRDPVIPVCLCEMPAVHWWAMRRYWMRLLPAVRGQFFAVGRARRAARVVAGTLGALSEEERQFFLVYLWGAFLGEAAVG